MEYRNLGRSGLKVSVVGLGGNNFGWRCDAEQTKAVVRKALDCGVTFFDTADVYGRGTSEEFLGEALKGQRQNVIIATKFGSAMGEGPYDQGASRRHIMDSIEGSLRRLGTDYIDLYQQHWLDPATPIEETLRALDDVVRQGKVRYVGCSNFAAWHVVEAQWIARSEHLTPFVSAQNEYNLLNRSVEPELVPACNAYGLGILPYYPLASGLLTGKYLPNTEAPQGSRLTGRMGARFLTEANFATVNKLESFAQSRGRSLLDLALGWLASQPHVASVIAGATKPEQVEQNVAAAEWRLTTGELTELDETLR